MGNLDALGEWLCNKGSNYHTSLLIVHIESYVVWKNLARVMRTKAICFNFDNRQKYLLYSHYFLIPYKLCLSNCLQSVADVELP